MATLREIMRFMCDCAAQSGHTFTDEVAMQLEQQLRSQYPGDRVYIPPPDKTRRNKIQADLKRLPVGVVAARNGVSKRWVYRLAKK